MDFRKDINGLRAVAVILVLLFHFHTPGFTAGFVGVDVFFVISGFLMTGIILRAVDAGDFSLLRFYRARLARLYPALLAMVAATLLFGLVFIEPGALARIAADGVSALLFVSNILFWREAGYFGAPADTMWLLHTWSLSVEWQFYLVYPLVLMFAAPFIRGTRARFLLLGAGFAASLALSVAAAELVANDRLVSFGFYMLPTRAWEMLAGGLVALRPDLLHGLGDRARRALELAGLAAIAASLALFADTTPWPSFHAVLPVAGAMLVLAAASGRSALSAAPLQHLGGWSYSIYLWHWPVVAALAYFGFDHAVDLAAGLLLSLVLGWASFRFIERPSRAWLAALPAARQGEGFAARPRFPAMGALAAAAFAVIALDAFTALQGGLPQRRPELVPVYAATLDAAADYAYPFGDCGGTTRAGNALRPCVVGAPSPQGDVLVIGDSFAEIWYPRVAALEAELRDHAVVFLTKGGCAPIAGMERVEPGMGCARFNDMAMAEARNGRYRTVILAGMWASYFTRDRSNAVICREGACASASTARGLQQAAAGLAASVDELHALGKQVVVLTTSPYPGFNVASEMRKRIFAGVDVPPHWSFDFEAVLERSLPIDGELASLRSHGADVIELAGLLCGAEGCPALRDMVPLYTDADHLRSSYTAAVGTFLDPYVLAPRPHGLSSAVVEAGLRPSLTN